LLHYSGGRARRARAFLVRFAAAARTALPCAARPRVASVPLPRIRAGCSGIRTAQTLIRLTRRARRARLSRLAALSGLTALSRTTAFSLRASGRHVLGAVERAVLIGISRIEVEAL